jgi:N-acetylglucosamine-6-phosphate deacetylase
MQAMTGTPLQVITAPQVLLDDVLVRDGWVAISGGRIEAVGTGIPPHPPTWPLPDGVLAPGLIDAQCNGAFGVHLAAADDQPWDLVLRSLPATGVTAVVPTFITAPLHQLRDALRAAAPRIREARREPAPGRARPLGIHVEGPFLSARRRGAHDASLLCDPDPDRLQVLLDAGEGTLLYLTLAPERPGASAAIQHLVTAGVRVAVGHSDASEEQVRTAADAGASLVTHLYNAQRPFGHRDPGVVGAALTDDRLTSGLIADLRHVAPTGIVLAFRAAPRRIMLVTDAIAALGMPPGTYDLGGHPTTVREGEPPLRDDGTIAGSALRLDTAIGNVVRCGIDPVDALLAATRIPADALGRTDLGRLEPGSSADLVWLGTDWQTRRTWIGGQPTPTLSPHEVGPHAVGPHGGGSDTTESP